MKNSRGFTLIEIMVGAAVALLVIGIVMSTFLAQQRSMQGLDLSREASNASRDAMLSMQGAIGRAGYGVDPRYAFDFRSYNCPSYTTTNPCRDKTTASDELVFVERDSNYYWPGTPSSLVQGCSNLDACAGHAWQVTNFTTGSPHQVTVKANQPCDTFLVGQVVEITCANGATPTMGQVSVSAKATAAGELLTVTLRDPVANNHYTDAVPAPHDACFDSGNPAPNNAGDGVTLFLVNRYRYFVTTVNGDPWLMLDRGLDYNNNGKTPENDQDPADLIPIAHGVEGMQIAYLLRPDPNGVIVAPDFDHNWVIGDSPADTVPEEADPSAPGPDQNTPDTSPLRFTLNPANIRGVRLRLTVRSLQTDRAQASIWPGDPAVLAPATSIENRDITSFPSGAALGRFRRYFTSVVVATPNLNSKDPFIF